MGKLTVEEVVTLIQKAKFRCDRGYPGERMPKIVQPAVAVNLYREEADFITMAVYVLSPVSKGGGVCEDFAGSIAELLRANGGECVQEHCVHDGRADRFSVRILATWRVDPPECGFSVHMNGLLAYATGFSARQTVETETVGAIGLDAPVGVLRRPQAWVFTLEELFPPDAEEPESPAEPFSILVRRSSVGEQYTGCYWQSILRKDTAEGLRQTRVGIAAGREVLRYD